MKVGQKLVFHDGKTYTIERINEVDNSIFQVEEEKRKFKIWYGKGSIDYKATIIKYMRDVSCVNCPICDDCRKGCVLELIAENLDEQFG